MSKLRATRMRTRSSGFGVVELMVAVALSLLLLTGVVAIFMSSRSSYETTDRVSRIQEVGRFAIDQISRDIRSAGYAGCVRAPTYLSSTLNPTGLQWDFLAGPIRGFEATDADTWDPTIDASIAATKGDVLVLRTPAREAQPLRLTASMGNGTDDLTVPAATTGIQTGDVAMAYSCEAQAFFHVTSFAGGVIQHGVGSGSPGNASADISYAFRENAEVIPVRTVVYYLAASTSAPDVTSLWRRTALNAPEELVEGVEEMQIQYGEDTNNDTVVDRYVNATAALNWANVYSVSVALLVRSLDAYGTDTDGRSYQLLTDTVAAPGDRHMREVFTTTANLRNRVPVN